MTGVGNYAPIGGTLSTETKSYFSIFKTKKTLCAFGFVFAFIASTIIIAFGPSHSSSSPWYSKILTTNFTSAIPSTSSIFSDGYQFSPFFAYFFPNAKHHTENTEVKAEVADLKPDHIQDTHLNDKVANVEANQTQNTQSNDQTQLNDNVANFEPIQTILTKNQTVSSSPKPSSEVKNGSFSVQKHTYGKARHGIKKLVKSLVNCNMYDGHWVKDDSYPLYRPDSCSLIDEKFNCFGNGRPDHDYYKLKWKPRGCTIPRLNGKHMLRLLRGKRLAFVGDSLNRNMWESLVCILRNSVKDTKKVYELNGNMDFRSEASYAFVFEDYNLSVEFYVSPFLVQEWEVTDQSGAKKETLRLDLVGDTSKEYKNADIIIFNSAHWWTHEKTSRGKDYYQEGSHVYSKLNVHEAFRKALTTWAMFVDANINPSKTHVLFRGYSASHFSGGQWNSGGQCHHETQPIMKQKYLMKYPHMMKVMEKVLKNMKVPVSYLNITIMSDYRKDGHPSIYRKQDPEKQSHLPPWKVQDCSHWCLPGVPDSWNELLYAELLVKMIGSNR